MKKLLMVVVAVLVAAAPARADRVCCADGRVIEGRVVSEDAETLRIERSIGTNKAVVTLARKEVTRIERGETPEQVFEAELARALTACECVVLGNRAKAANLHSQAARAYERALALDPADRDAHERLGHRFDGGRWLTDREWKLAHGYVERNGQLLSPDQFKAAEAASARKGTGGGPPAGASSAPGPGTPAEPEIDYLSVLFAFHVGRSDTVASGSEMEKGFDPIQEAYIRAYSACSCGQFTWTRSAAGAPGLLTQAAKNGCGFALDAVITFRAGKAHKAPDRTVETPVSWEVNQTMWRNNGKAGWVKLFATRADGDPLQGFRGGGRLQVAFLSRNPAEADFFRSLVPIRVLSVPATRGGHLVNAEVRNNYPYPVLRVALELELSPAKRDGRPVSLQTDSKAVRIEPGAFETVQFLTKEDRSQIGAAWPPASVSLAHLEVESRTRK